LRSWRVGELEGRWEMGEDREKRAAFSELKKA